MKKLIIYILFFLIFLHAPVAASEVMDWYYKGNIYYEQHQYNDALTAYNKAIELDPNFTYAWNGIGNVQDLSGRTDEALTAYNKAIELNPTYYQAWDNKGNVFNSLGQYGEALAAFNKSLEINPNDDYAKASKNSILSKLSQLTVTFETTSTTLSPTPIPTPTPVPVSLPDNFTPMMSFIITILLFCIFGVGFYIYYTGKKSQPQLLSSEQKPKPIPLLKSSRDLIFISSKSEDFNYTQQVYTFLKDRGYNVFFSQLSLPDMGSSDYRKEIDSALDTSKHMLVITSKKGFVEAPWVEAEWGLFINEKRSGRKSGNIITFIIGTMRIEDLPSSLRYYEVIPFDPKNFEKILKYLK